MEKKDKDDVFKIHIPNLSPDEIQYVRKAISTFAKELLNKLQALRSARKNMN